MYTDDRRVRKTKKALREALAELLIDKDLKNITVREITDKADIHRATFYSHYHDVYDLYTQVVDSVIQDLDLIINDISLNCYEDVFEGLITYVQDNAMLCKMLFCYNGNRSFQDKVCDLLEANYLKYSLHEEKYESSPEDWQYLISYHIKGCIAIISQWVSSNFSFSKEKLIKIILRIDNNMDILMRL